MLGSDYATIAEMLADYYSIMQSNGLDWVLSVIFIFTLVGILIKKVRY